MGDLIPLDKTSAGELVVIAQIRLMLAEARTLPEFRRVIEAAEAMSDTARRYAKLAEAERLAADTVQAANDAANDLADVRLQAQAEAGLLAERMVKEGRIVRGGELLDGRGEQGEARPRKHVSEEMPSTWQDVLGAETPNGARIQVHQWRKVAGVPKDVREEYVQKVKDEGGEVTTAGLLRYATPKEPKERTSVEASYDDVVRLASQLLRYDPVAIAAHAGNTKRRTQFRKLMEQLRDWADKTDPILT